MDVTHVVWDWNGTLFDDVNCSVDVANQLLTEFGLRTFADLSEYHRTFRFPIVDYYADLGFDTSPDGNFETAAHRFVELYAAASTVCRLHPGAEETLAALHGAGVTQVVLSATKRSRLLDQVAPFHLDRWVEGFHGLDDIYAHSKEGLARGWLDRVGVPAERVLFVGDSEHDFEIADAVGAHCVLFSGGHHGRARLEPLGVHVVDALPAVATLVLGEPGRRTH